MEIILSVLLFISMVFNFVLLKYQPTVYVVPEPTLTTPVMDVVLEEQVVRAPPKIIEPEADDEFSDIRSSRGYSPWKNETGIQQTMPNSSSHHKPAPPLKPLERPYGFSR